MASAYELVRVEDPSTGHQYTTSRAHAESAGLTRPQGQEGRQLAGQGAACAASHHEGSRARAAPEGPAQDRREGLLTYGYQDSHRHPGWRRRGGLTASAVGADAR
ncbi:hypothetical protein EHLJMEHL_05037 [Vreelandella titanicae]